MDQATWGADPEGLEQFASDLSQASGQFRKIQRKLSARVHSAPWSGLDAREFLDSWRGPYSSSLLSTASALEQAASIVRRNAAEQRAASAGESGSTSVGTGLASGISGGGGGGGGWGYQSGWHGWSGPAEVSGSGSIGPLTLTGGANVETFKSHTDSGIYFTTPKYDPLTGGWSPLAVGATASAAYNIAAVSANSSAKLGAATVGATASASVGAQAGTQAGISMGLQGIGAHAGIGGSAGARVDGSASADAYGQEATLQGHLIAGVEAHADIDANVSLNKVEMSVAIGAALGIGGGMDFKVELDPIAAAKNLEKFADLW
jgi:hypothetical protein